MRNVVLLDRLRRIWCSIGGLAAGEFGRAGIGGVVDRARAGAESARVAAHVADARLAAAVVVRSCAAALVALCDLATAHAEASA